MRSVASPIASITRGLSSPSPANSPSVSSACSYCSMRVIRHRRMIASDAAEILRVADSEDPRLQQMLQRPVVFLQAELAQTQKRDTPRRSSAQGAPPCETHRGTAGSCRASSTPCPDTSSPRRTRASASAAFAYRSIASSHRCAWRASVAACSSRSNSALVDRCRCRRALQQPAASRAAETPVCPPARCRLHGRDQRSPARGRSRAIRLPARLRHLDRPARLFAAALRLRLGIQAIDDRTLPVRIVLPLQPVVSGRELHVRFDEIGRLLRRSPRACATASSTLPVCRRRLASSLRAARSSGRIVVARSR